jgi:tetratricopeptide (TPR) repeat protein
MTLVPLEVRASSTVDELVREARAHEAAHEEDLALKRYTEAVALDAACAECYLGLGALRAQLGDLREAERVFSVALAHVPAEYQVLYARARVRRLLGWRDDAAQDLEAYVSKESSPIPALRELAGWYAADGKAPAQLAVWRRILILAGDPATAGVARTTVRALQILIGPVDPVVGPLEPSGTRRAFAAIARRGG